MHYLILFLVEHAVMLLALLGLQHYEGKRTRANRRLATAGVLAVIAVFGSFFDVFGVGLAAAAITLILYRMLKLDRFTAAVVFVLLSFANLFLLIVMQDMVGS